MRKLLLALFVAVLTVGGVAGCKHGGGGGSSCGCGK
jgi:hypothetical protein